jgi:hypothetical protein
MSTTRPAALAAMLIAALSCPAFAQDNKAGRESVWKNLLPPDDQDKMRDERAFTVGIPLVNPYNLPGALQWRPTSRFLIGYGFDSSIMNNCTPCDLDHGLELNANQQSQTLYLQIYPIKKSGFYLGIGAEARAGTFTVEQQVSNGGDPVQVGKGSYEAIYGGPTFGWTWLWENGVTVGFDISKRKRFKGQITFDAGSNVPTGTDGAVGAQLMPDGVLGTFMLGYSF